MEEEDLRLAARKVAQDYLAELLDGPGRTQLARARLKKAFRIGLVDIGDPTWNRRDLYDR
jgi:hypothetical protein